MMKFRPRFPLLVSQPELVYLDSASTTQRMDTVLDRLDHYYRETNANVHRGLYALSENATMEFEAVRETVRLFLNARETTEVVFTSGATQGLNLIAQGYGNDFLDEGDEVLLTVLEHHSNIVPWQMMARFTGAILKFVPILEDGRLDMAAMEAMVTAKTKIIAVTGLSNVLGTVVDLKQVVRLARDKGYSNPSNHCRVVVDGAQLVAHFLIDVQALDIDALVFSSHKIYGPTGAGVLWGRRDFLEKMNPLLGGGGMIREVSVEGTTWNDVPWKFEAGTPPIAQVLGMGAAIEFLMEVGMDHIAAYDRVLMEYVRAQFSDLRGVRLWGPPDGVGVLSFDVEGVHPHDVSAILAEQGVCVRAGHHCAMPLMKELGVLGTTRASFGVYNNESDVDRLVQGLKKVQAVFSV